ncbi:MAG: hypothetical protein RR348_00935 [Clostridia bacterium]
MKKRIILIISILLIVAMSVSVFIACASENANIGKFVKTIVPQQKNVVAVELSGAPALDANTSIMASASNKYGVVYRQIVTVNEKQISKYAIYCVADKTLSPWRENFSKKELFSLTNGNTGAFLWSFTNEFGASEIVDCNGSVVFTCKTGDKLYFANYNKQRSGVNEIVVSYNSTSYVFNNYKFVNSSDNALNGSMFSKDGSIIYGKNIIVHINNDDTVATIYDKNQNNFLRSIDFSSLQNFNSSVSVVTMLNNANLLVQVSNVLPNDSKKFDILDSTGVTKMEVCTYIVNTQTGKSSQVNCNYLLGGKMKNEQTLGEKYNCAYENYIFGQKFANGSLQKAKVMIAFDNNMVTKFVGTSPLLSNMTSFEQVADAKFAIYSANKTSIIDTAGNVEKTYNQDLTGKAVYGVGFRLSGDILVDYFGAILFDSANKTVISKVEGITYFSEEILEADGTTTKPHYFRQDKGAEKVEILNYSSFNKSQNYYVVLGKTAGIKTVYNAYNGEQLTSAPNANFDSLNDGTLFVKNANNIHTIIFKTDVATI